MRITTGAFVLLMLLTACEQKARWNEMDFAKSSAGSFRSDEYKPNAQFQFAADKTPAERKLIKTGSIEFEVDNVEKTKTSILDLVKEFNGYISSDDQNNYGGAPRFSQVARIPADRLDDFISKIEALAKNVESKNISTQDVTEEFIDVETRLATKKELEARYREILRQAKAVKDVLEVETQLNNVRAEIESMEGRLKYLNNQTSLSTLTITYYQTVSGNYGFGYRFFGSFGTGWDNLLNFIIGLLQAWPFVLMAIGAVWLFIRLRRKRKLAS